MKNAWDNWFLKIIGNIRKISKLPFFLYKFKEEKNQYVAGDMTWVIILLILKLFMSTKELIWRTALFEYKMFFFIGASQFFKNWVSFYPLYFYIAVQLFPLYQTLNEPRYFFVIIKFHRLKLSMVGSFFN